MSADWTVVGERLRGLRDGRRWTQGQVAERLVDWGITLHPSAISKIEAGERALRLDEGAAFAGLFQIDLDNLVPSPLVSSRLMEPDNLGAVVEDGEGVRWVRVAYGTWGWLPANRMLAISAKSQTEQPGYGFAELGVVRVLHEGWVE
ncbi:hypothetical protein CFH99_07965 [Nocardioides aromaticivorans]|uniref:HTH cro/C1-type domain-containing protein n=1 Tax=Nocardioides aromaticivorans TaxID=200618 RepID=A0ABX7PIE4_9ACTN|nr:helix-turn-helix transcriptional regulator [Nocardioides aromaticivorans]QSR25557.1 hypothetical protein CFH99_07965 [Nocardioides aromaticivorans]